MKKKIQGVRSKIRMLQAGGSQDGKSVSDWEDKNNKWIKKLNKIYANGGDQYGFGSRNKSKL